MGDVKTQDLKIEEITFHHNPWVTTRVRNVLRQNGIHTLSQLLELTEEDLGDMRNLGAISLANIKVKLESMGLKLKEPGW
jgi:DNA-directed RNA polymerase alpha subunit